jgi:hypothetical protein
MGIVKISTKSNLHLRTAWLHIVIDLPLDLKEIYVFASGSERSIKIKQDKSPSTIATGEGQRVLSFQMDWSEYTNLKLNKQMFDVRLLDQNGTTYSYENNLIS